MTTKRKLCMSILSLVFVILALGVASFSVLSATQQYVSANLSVVYNADNVKATIKGKYSVNNGSFVSLVNSLGGEMVSFEGKEDYSSKTLSNDGGNISLSPTVTNVFFIYTFTNANASGGRSMTVSFADTSTKTNVTVKYLSSTTTEPTRTNTIASTNTTGNFQLIISAGSSAYVGVYVQITSVYADASYVSSASAGISSTLESVT